MHNSVTGNSSGEVVLIIFTSYFIIKEKVIKRYLPLTSITGT
nr:MAG TPA: hypothetical protein [Caudoviricetes sp.]